ncbi:hypothetical protein RRF57_005432 [Xylaria bambusicola]|uniref:Uncharacterized protein n=1 Tax=Xylaria bambusicola TaxID=326684 RepID=A0AAN7Z4S7_9PEZI
MSLFLDEARHRPRRLAHKVEEPLQPWTTARCQRLLRPLISRITSLRRDSFNAGRSAASTARSALGSAAVSFTRKNRLREEIDSESGWLMPRKKRPRLTYSQRRSSQPPPSQHLGLDQCHLRQDSQDETSSPVIRTKPGVRKAFKCVQPDRQQRTAAPGEVYHPHPYYVVLEERSHIHLLHRCMNMSWTQAGANIDINVGREPVPVPRSFWTND